jgi:hypothetical protein
VSPGKGVSSNPPDPFDNIGKATKFPRAYPQGSADFVDRKALVFDARKTLPLTPMPPPQTSADGTILAGSVGMHTGGLE